MASSEYRSMNAKAPKWSVRWWSKPMRNRLKSCSKTLSWTRARMSASSPSRDR